MKVPAPRPGQSLTEIQAGLEIKPKEKDLGMLLDERLNMSQHEIMCARSPEDHQPDPRLHEEKCEQHV